jgi:hypothetical protein
VVWGVGASLDPLALMSWPPTHTHAPSLPPAPPRPQNPYFYTRYSVAGYGTSTPNYWKIQEYCGGDVNNASPENLFCYTCEPPDQNSTYSDFDFFPEPTYSPTWQAAIAYVQAGAASQPVQPAWDANFISGQQWTDPNTGDSVLLPGSGLYNALKRDPYADLVSLAKDLGAAGVDVDYEEMWHADFHKQGPAGGPWTMPQTVYKYSAIMKDVQLNIAAQAPGMLMSSPVGAASGWAGNWWGGNLKGQCAPGAVALSMHIPLPQQPPFSHTHTCHTCTPRLRCTVLCPFAPPSPRPSGRVLSALP